MKLYYSAFFVCTLAAASVYIYAAQQDSTSFNVSITIKEMCNVTTGNGTDLDFGTVSREPQYAKYTPCCNLYTRYTL